MQSTMENEWLSYKIFPTVFNVFRNMVYLIDKMEMKCLLLSTDKNYSWI